MRLFISYAHENHAAVRELADLLNAGGHFVWFDDEILPGQDWKRELGQRIAASDAFVYALTQSSVHSEWCQWELAEAARLQKSIMPVMLEAAVAIPAPLRTLQYADFTKGATPVAAAKLMAGLQLLQKLPPSEAPPAPAEPSGVPSRAWKSAKHWTDKIVTPYYKPQNETEEVLGKFGVTLRRGLEGVGGRMILTNQRLLFEAHGINLQREPVSIPLDDIRGVKTYNSLGLVPNGFTVQCHSGREYRFIAFNRQQIIDLIRQQARIALA